MEHRADRGLCQLVQEQEGLVVAPQRGGYASTSSPSFSREGVSLTRLLFLLC